MSESQKQFATNWRKLAEEAAWFIDNNVGKLDHLIDYEGKTALLEKIAAAGETIPSEIGEKCRAEGCQWIAPSVTLTTAAPQGGALPTLPASREGESPAVAAPVSFPSAIGRSEAEIKAEMHWAAWHTTEMHPEEVLCLIANEFQWKTP